MAMFFIVGQGQDQRNAYATDMVRAFDPRTIGVVKVGRVVKVGTRYAHVDFGLTGVARVPFRDVLEVVSHV